MASRQLGVLIEYICDAHPSPDGVGPLITRLDGSWAYCPGNGGGDHGWRRIDATPRDALESRQLAKRGE